MQWVAGMEKSGVSLLPSLGNSAERHCTLSVVLCCRGPFNSSVAVDIFFLEAVIIAPLRSFFSTKRFMSDEPRASSFMQQTDGREIAGVII